MFRDMGVGAIGQDMFQLGGHVKLGAAQRDQFFDDIGPQTGSAVYHQRYTGAAAVDQF